MHILVVVAIAAVVSIIASSPLFMKPKFKSTARIYPMNILEASKESESEHLLENVQSIDIKFRVIDAFHLDKVYKISKDEKLYQTYILYEFDQNVTFRKTEFETIEIKVLDEDPKRACAMVDSIIKFTNEQIQQQQAKKHLEYAWVAERDLKLKSREIDSLTQMVQAIRDEYQLLDYFQQSEIVTQGLMFASAFRGDNKPAKEITNKLLQKGGELRKYQLTLRTYEIEADTLKSHYDKGISMATSNLSYCKVVQSPFPADKKSYPVRWIILLASVFAAAFLSVLTVSFIDYIREIRLAE
jgi:hypothetical protein